MKKALLFGATGMVGAALLDALLASPDYAQVTVVVRRPLARSHPRLTVLIGDDASLPALRPQLAADELFIALGTTRAKTPDQRRYYEIDHDYPLLAARLAREAGARAVFLVSAVGADAGSRIFYVRTKGELERDITTLGYPAVHIFRPSMLLGPRAEHRPLEWLAAGLFRLLNPLLRGSTLGKYHGVSGVQLATAMVTAAAQEGSGVRVYHWPEIKALLKGR